MPWSPLDPKRLLILRIVALKGSISAAARTLGWTPPAVSQHLAALERAVGVPLIHRHRAGVELTEAGSILVRHADGIADHLTAALDEVESLSRRDDGAVRLGCFASAMTGLVPAVLESLRNDDGASLEVLLTESHPTDSVALLRAGEIDLALVYDYEDPAPGDNHRVFPLAADLAAIEVGGDAMAAVLSPAHPLASAATVTLADLKDCRWIAGCELCRRHLESCATTAGYQPNVTHLTHDTYVIRALVGADASGRTVATTPTSVASVYRESNLAVHLLPEMPGRRFYALHRFGADSVPAFQRVLTTLQEVGTSLDARPEEEIALAA